MMMTWRAGSISSGRCRGSRLRLTASGPITCGIRLGPHRGRLMPPVMQDSRERTCRWQRPKDGAIPCNSPIRLFESSRPACQFLEEPDDLGDRAPALLAGAGMLLATQLDAEATLGAEPLHLGVRPGRTDIQILPAARAAKGTVAAPSLQRRTVIPA